MHVRADVMFWRGVVCTVWLVAITTSVGCTAFQSATGMETVVVDAATAVAIREMLAFPPKVDGTKCVVLGVEMATGGAIVTRRCQ